MKKPSILFILLFAAMAGCENIGVFEKNVTIPNQEWSSNFIPEVKFQISDTTSRYNLFVVVRHTDAYRYNNIWMNIYTQVPGKKENKQRLDLRLATDDKGWLGSGMDDLFEHRILVSPVKFPDTGTYTFRFENLMREDPLQHILNVGLRVEKLP